MMLNALCGFGVGGGFALSETISANINNFNLKTAALAAGWNGIDPINGTITINIGVVVGSTSVLIPSIYSDVDLPPGSILSIINNGKIKGKGGNGQVVAWTSASSGYHYGVSGPEAGGTAIKVTIPTTVTNNGTVAGGGGGSAGRSGYTELEYYGPEYAACGGGGAGAVVGAGGSVTDGGLGGSASGDAGTGTTGGVGRTAGGVSIGAGGNLGQAGADGYYCTWVDSPSRSTVSGGAAGKYAEGNSLITWLVAGTRLGGTS